MDILAEIRRVLDLEGRTLLGLLNTVGPNYDQAVHLLYTCSGKVVVTGVGKSGLIAQKIAATMVSTGTPALFLHGSEGMHGDIGIVEKHDVVVCIGKSGESDELVAILPVVRQIGAKVISITAKPDSTMTRHSDVVLMTPIEEEACPLNMAPTCSTTAALAIGDALAMALMKLRNFQPTDFALLHPGGQLGKRLLWTVGDLMRSGDANPIIHINSDPKLMLYEMTSKRAGAVSVVDDYQHLLGLVTDYDIRRVLEAGKDLFKMAISDVMNPKPSFISMNEKAIHALEMMEKREKPISLLPVLDSEQKVVGMVHIHDLVSRGL